MKTSPVRYCFYFMNIIASSRIIAVMAKEWTLGNSDLFRAFASV